MTALVADGWVECWSCWGHGDVAGCHEDVCTCLGDPEDPDECCAPSPCTICDGKGGWPARIGCDP